MASFNYRNGLDSTASSPSLGWLIDGSVGQLRKCPQGKKGGRGEEEFDV